MMNLSVQSINKWHHGRNLPDIDFEIIQNHSGLLNKRIAYLSKYCAMVFKHDNKMHSVLVSPC